MKVGVGYSDNPESNPAGLEAAQMALTQAQREGPCDLALMFSTARHDQTALREAVASVLGASVPVYGGGAAGVITNDFFGYAGDQIALACIWLDGVECAALVEGGLNESEETTGIRLGRRLAELGAEPDSPVMLFYDALDCREGVRMLMATWLLQGLEKGLGFIPDLTGAGLMGDHACSPTQQWIGQEMGGYKAIALAFSGDIRLDNVIMHGCRPATDYYTVTKAAGQVILEINGKPALQFIDELLNSAIAPEQYPFFLIFGVNHGERWGEYNEDYYASRLCLGIDPDSGGIVMFEPDMVEGTEFQLMFRSLELDYLKPKIDRIFSQLNGREPVFAVYIDCAGRCSGYAGNDLEDALVLQEAVAGRVPLLGLYTGVEIASIGGRPRGLDWTGVFCLFSQGEDQAGATRHAAPAWDSAALEPASKEIPLAAITKLCEQNAARYLALDTNSIAIRYELEQKRRGFSLLAELAVSLRQNDGYDNVFTTVTKRINAALNMQRTVVLRHIGDGLFTAEVLQGYTAKEKAELAGQRLRVAPELLNPEQPVISTGEDPAERFKELKTLLGLPYFISSPVLLQGEVYAILLTGRLVEAGPYLVRLSRSDMETVQAISALLASVLAGQRLAAAEERNRIMVDTVPLCCALWDENGNLTYCNKETLTLFGLSSIEEFIQNYFTLSPEYQPDGSPSQKTGMEHVMKAFVSGEQKYPWLHMMPDGETFPTEITLIRAPKGEDYILLEYIRDLREQEAAQVKMEEARELAERYIKAKSEFIAAVSHEIRTPLNAIKAMADVTQKITNLDQNLQSIVEQGSHSIQLLTSAIDTILDFSTLDSGQLALEIKEFSVNRLMEGICGMIRSEAALKSLHFNLTVDPATPETLLGDPERLRQIVFNIVMNAVKFTANGGVDVSVFQEEQVFADEIWLTFEVRDTGIGITADQMANMFKPLYSGDSSYSRKQTGLGMGLSISSSLATLMGGKITCESQPGAGSVFRATIPFNLPAEDIVEAETAPVVAEVERLRGLRVLVAEDNSINQMIMEELLSIVGIEVTLADNGLEVLEKLAPGRFDLILMDIQMPEMDGLTATAQIRADGRYAALPILAMTANAGQEHYDESIKAGMNDHLTKPVDMDHLYQSLLKWSKKQ